MRILRSIAATSVFAAVAVACLDQSPLPYVEPDGSELPDAAVDMYAPGGPNPACMPCLKAACASELAACDANPKCAAFAACMDSSRCWGASLTDLAHIPPCLFNCGAVAGFTGQADPSAVAAGPLIICAQDPKACAAACVGGVDQ